MRYMYFGTKRKMRWVKVHSPSSSYAMGGASERVDFQNGGVAIRESVNGHMEYTLTWNSMTSEESRAVTDHAYGLSGSGSIHFVDPVASTQNVLNKAWSAPGITAKDGIPLAGNRRPQLLRNLDDRYDYPVEMARYDLATGDASRSFYVPVPPGFVAWVGVHGDATSTLGVSVQSTSKGTPVGVPSVIPVTSVGIPDRFSHQFAASAEQSGIEIRIQTDISGFISLAGLMVQVLPVGMAPASGGFISGQGASGCQFEGKVQAVPYSTYHDRYGLSVKLVETEDWIDGVSTSSYPAPSAGSLDGGSA